MLFKAISIIAVACAGVESAALDLVTRSHEQQQLVLSESKDPITYDVRRFAVSSNDDAVEVVRQAKSNDLDVWSLSDDHVDIYFPAGSPVPPYFQTLNHTQFSPVHEAISTGRFPAEGPWDVSTVTDCRFHNTFHNYTEIDAFVQQLADEFPQFVEIVKLGRSSEGRDIIALNITKKSAKSTKKRKRRMVIQGAQHAREWIASSTALYIAHSLVSDTTDKHSKHKLLNHMDFSIIPLPNPDGYAYTWERDRLWYKNRQDVGGGKCKGVDLNRNWGYEWQPSADDDPCSHWFPGDHAFDALESRAVSAYISRTPNIRAFLDLRSYGQIIMRPFSHSCDSRPKDEENLMEAALGAAKAMTKAHGTVMRTGSLCHKLYSAPGNIVDWMYGYAKVKVAYSVMLRDTGTYGFLLPPSWVRPVGEETAEMVDYLARWIKHRKP